MSTFNYKAFYDRVGKQNGWDFSKVQCTVAGEMPNLYHLAAQHSPKKKLLLDIGTGGGEQVLEHCRAFQLVVGIDSSYEMIHAANTNLKASEHSNFRFFQMDCTDLKFPDHMFDMVSCRQAPFDPNEVSRVLAPSGLFITQQVSEHDKYNLKQAFNRGQSYGEADGAQQKVFVHQLQEAGFINIEVHEYDVTEYYHSAEDLIFLLKHTPIIPSFGIEEQDFDILEKFIADNQQSKGIKTNSKRYIVTASRGV
ncbi:class I SAM-dependent methyltransferase [Paenibacillus sp. FSL W7-1287]|uniref:class I SAM-dependent methyltransferase n=1 Tax=Paenibacillus sp. FSL W7-1287 TaxID=2954538 RepID=UPI0030F75672